MGLIEKAGAMEAADCAPAEPRAAAADFEIDFAALAARGVYAPQDSASRLSLELRAIK
ncbi:MAG: hypothetical protein AB7P23_02655 [Amphiplicatus sp.]